MHHLAGHTDSSCAMQGDRPGRNQVTRATEVGESQPRAAYQLAEAMSRKMPSVNIASSSQRNLGWLFFMCSSLVAFCTIVSTSSVLRVECCELGHPQVTQVGQCGLDGKLCLSKSNTP